MVSGLNTFLRTVTMVSVSVPEVLVFPVVMVHASLGKLTMVNTFSSLFCRPKLILPSDVSSVPFKWF